MTQGPTLSGSPTVLVFRTEWYGNIPTGTPRNGGVDCLERMTKSRFSTNISLHVGNDAR